MPEVLEAEVIEVDGRPPRSPQPPPPRPAWTIRLDRRWWPLWVLLGGITLVLGSVFFFVAAIFLLLRGLLRWLFRP